MNKNIPLLTASIIFFVISIIHLVRVFLGIQIVIANFVVPMNASLIGFFVTLALSIWMFAASRR